MDDKYMDDLKKSRQKDRQIIESYTDKQLKGKKTDRQKVR